MLDTPLFERRRDKVTDALERAKISMMNAEDDKNIRPLLGKAGIVERVKPEDPLGPIPGANQVPCTLTIPAQEGASGGYFLDLPGDWIDQTAVEAMIPRFVEWVRQGIRDRKLPSGFRIEATTEHPGQDEYGRIIPQRR